MIDKDFGSPAKMARNDRCGYCLSSILTAVEQESLSNYGQTNRSTRIGQQPTSRWKCKRTFDRNPIAPGSMLPKVEAAIALLLPRKAVKPVIASLEKAAETFSWQ